MNDMNIYETYLAPMDWKLQDSDDTTHPSVSLSSAPKHRNTEQSKSSTILLTADITKGHAAGLCDLYKQTNCVYLDCGV